MRKTTNAYLILIVLITMGCSGNKRINANNNTNPLLRLHDIWALTSLNGSSENLNLEKRPVLELFPDKKEMLGFGGCNQYSGSIAEVNTTEISFGAIRSTKMACEQIAIESEYFAALQATQTYTLNGLELTFIDGRGVPVLIFKKVD